MTKNRVPLFPNGFSKDAQKRIEKAMVLKAQKEAAQIPQLPPDLAANIAAGVAMAATQGKFSNIQVGLGSPINPAHVRILIFKDDITGQAAQALADKNKEAPKLEGVPGSAPVPEATKEYEVGTTEDAKDAGSELPPSAVGDTRCEKTEEVPAEQLGGVAG